MRCAQHCSSNLRYWRATSLTLHVKLASNLDIASSLMTNLDIHRGQFGDQYNFRWHHCDLYVPVKADRPGLVKSSLFSRDVLMLFFIFPALAPITFSFQSCSLISGALLKGLVAEQWESAMVAFILRRCCLRSLVNVRRQCFPLGALPNYQRVCDFERIQRVIPPIAFFFFFSCFKQNASCLAVRGVFLPGFICFDC